MDRMNVASIAIRKSKASRTLRRLTGNADEFRSFDGFGKFLVTVFLHELIQFSDGRFVHDAILAELS